MLFMCQKVNIKNEKVLPSHSHQTTKTVLWHRELSHIAARSVGLAHCVLAVLCTHLIATSTPAEGNKELNVCLHQGCFYLNLMPNWQIRWCANMHQKIYICSSSDCSTKKMPLTKQKGRLDLKLNLSFCRIKMKDKRK